MAYSIRTGPVFRHIFKTYEKNPELRKLKEEYERIVEFNEHTIDMKVRQTRLKKLFNDIEDIKENALRQPPKPRPIYKTPEELRKERVIQSRELGKEYAKFYAVFKSEQPIVSPTSKKIPLISESTIKTRAAKRISYGNEISRENLQKMPTVTCKKFNVSEYKSKIDLAAARDAEKKKDALKKRINYGNSRSTANINNKNSKNHKNQLKIDQVAAKSGVQNALAVDDISRTIDDIIIESCTTKQEKKRQRALKNWQKVRLLLNTIITIKNRYIHSTGVVMYIFGRNEDKENEYNLRPIADYSEIPKSVTQNAESVSPGIIKDPESQEVLVRVQRLNVPPPPEKKILPSISCKRIDRMDLNLPKECGYVKRFVQMFDPIMRENHKNIEADDIYAHDK